MANLETVYNFIKRNKMFKLFDVALETISINITINNNTCLLKSDLQELYLIMSMFVFFDYTIHTHSDILSIRIWSAKHE